MPKIACVGDEHICLRHGRNVIIEGGSSLVDGRAVARVGDRCSCGCVIVEGWPGAICDGRLVAFMGAKTTGGSIGSCAGSATLV